MSFHLCTAEQEGNFSDGKCEFGDFSSIGGSSSSRKRRRTQIPKPDEKGPDGKIKQSTRKKKHVESERHCTDGAPCSRPHYSKQRFQDGFFSIASNRRCRDKSDVFQEETAFVPCKCFGAWTDALARHQKGDMVMVEGDCAPKLGTMTAHHARNSFWFAIPCSLLSRNRDRRIRRSPTKAASENTRRLRPAGKPTASRRFERRTHRMHSLFVRAELGYPSPGARNLTRTAGFAR